MLEQLQLFLDFGRQTSAPAAPIDQQIVDVGVRASGVVPIPSVVVAVFGRALELGFGDAGPVAAELGVVFERLPGNRVVIVAEVEAPSLEALERVTVPAWALRDVTDDRRYSAIALAALG